MEVIEYKKMGDFEKHYWWHKGKKELVKQLYLKYFNGQKDLEILEIGCGTGEILSLLKQWGNTTGLDVSQEALDYCKTHGFQNLILEDINSLDLNQHESKYDLILALDVLEHIQEDVTAMKQVYKMLKPGGMFFVTVPAYKFLWSNHDEALHHKRRYHSVEIKLKLKDVGFKILKHSHFVFTVFFPISFIKFMENFVNKKAYAKTHYVPVPKFLNDLFTKILYLEAKLIKYLYLPLGTTIVVVAKKDE